MIVGDNQKLYMPDLIVSDLASPVYNRDLSYAQQLRVLLDGGFTVDDYDWWGHCVFGCDVVVGASQRTVSRDESMQYRVDTCSATNRLGHNTASAARIEYSSWATAGA